MSSAFECSSSMGADDDEWDYFTNPPPDDNDPSRPAELEISRTFVGRYGTPRAIPVSDAARQLMSLCNEDVDVALKHPGVEADKGGRIGWLLWDVMPHYQPAILELVGAVQALPTLERTEQQIKEWQFEEKWPRWRDMEDFWSIWDETYERYWENRYPADVLDGEGFLGFVNANAFYANYLGRYHSNPLRPLPIPSGAALRSIVRTLERDPWNHASPRTTELAPHSLRWSGEHERHITMLNTMVHALVAFFEIAGPVIYSYIDEGNDPLRVAIVEHLGGNLWKGGSDLTKSLWDFWKDRLRWISEQHELKLRTRDEAKMLVGLMARLEEKECT